MLEIVKRNEEEKVREVNHKMPPLPFPKIANIDTGEGAYEGEKFEEEEVENRGNQKSAKAAPG